MGRETTMTPRRAMGPLRGLAIAMIAVYSIGCLGCGSEARLAGTPTHLPPGTMPPAPPLTQSPIDMAKAAKIKGKKARP